MPRPFHILCLLTLSSIVAFSQTRKPKPPPWSPSPSISRRPSRSITRSAFNPMARAALPVQRPPVRRSQPDRFPRQRFSRQRLPRQRLPRHRFSQHRFSQQRFSQQRQLQFDFALAAGTRQKIFELAAKAGYFRRTSTPITRASPLPEKRRSVTKTRSAAESRPTTIPPTRQCRT